MKKLIISLGLLLSYTIAFAQSPSKVVSVANRTEQIRNQAGIRAGDLLVTRDSGKVFVVSYDIPSSTPKSTVGSLLESGKLKFYSGNNTGTGVSTHDTVFIDPGHYKVFKGFINQVDTGLVVVSQLENSIGEIVWTWDPSHLVLNAVLNGAFTAGNTLSYAIDPLEGFKAAGVADYAPDRITWELGSYSGSITNLFVEIRVYP
ncbi:MAG: hypothetical protein NTW10_02420 [Bacteroidetes bacterium]|nr:hypothetical protein [Bacteroidota bacterium]